MDRKSPKASMTGIGEKLRNAREKKGLSIDQVQKQTHVYSRVLAALEEGRCDELLPPTYVKSFLKKYSQFLRLDSGEIIKEYSSLHPDESNVNASSLNIAEPKTTDILSRFIYVASFILILIVALSFTAFLVKRIAAIAKKPEMAGAASGIKGRHIAPPNAPHKIKAVSQSASQPKISIPKKEPINLTIKVKQAVLIEVKKDGSSLFKRVLPKGASESVVADDRVDIYAAKAEAIELVLNGKALGSPGRGVIKNIEITRRGIRLK